MEAKTQSKRGVWPKSNDLVALWDRRAELTRGDFECLVQQVADCAIDSRNLYQVALFSRLFQFCDPSLLDSLAEFGLQQHNEFKRYLVLACVCNDYSCAQLRELVNACKQSSHEEVSRFASIVEGRTAGLRGRLRTLLDSALRTAGGASYTLYIHNPPPAGSLRLYISRGLLHQEAVHGAFIDPASTQKVAYSSQCAPTGEHQGGEGNRLRILTQLAQTDNLYADFVQREKIVRSWKRVVRSGGEPRCIVFFNFRVVPKQPEAVVDELAIQLEHELDKGSVFEGLQEGIFSRVGEHESLERLKAPFLERSDALTLVNDSMGDALSILLNELGLSEQDAQATLFRVDERFEYLSVVGGAGKNGGGGRDQSVSLENGKEISAWVCLKQRPLVVNDMDSSEFSQLVSDEHDCVRSAIVVPVFSWGRKPFGVLRIESGKHDAFRSEHLRLTATFAQWLGEHLEIRHDIKKVYSRIRSELSSYSGGVGEGVTLDEYDETVSRLAKEHLQADYCHVWCKAIAKSGFLSSSSSGSGTANANPRSNGQGWTGVVVEVEKPIWLMFGEDNRVEQALQCANSSWTPVEGPKFANPGLKGRVRCELGCPVYLKQKLVAVVWLKYLQRRPPPIVEDLDLAGFFAEQSAFTKLRLFAA